MRRHGYSRLIAGAALTLLFCGGTLYALPQEVRETNNVLFSTAREDMNSQAIKERMKQRLPQVVKWKKSGQVGETYDGYLALVDPAKIDAKTLPQMELLIAQENRDRQAVYQAIAKSQQTTVALVGQRRALQIADDAPKGEWFRDAKGGWSAKKTDPKKK